MLAGIFHVRISPGLHQDDRAALEPHCAMPPAPSTA